MRRAMNGLRFRERINDGSEDAERDEDELSVDLLLLDMTLSPSWCGLLWPI